MPDLLDVIESLARRIRHLETVEQGIITTISTGPSTLATISGGAITFAATYMRVDTEGSAASDDLDTISGGTAGTLLILRSTNNDRDVTVKDGTSLKLAGDCVLGTTNDRIMLQCVFAGVWAEIARSING